MVNKSQGIEGKPRERRGQTSVEAPEGGVGGDGSGHNQHGKAHKHAHLSRALAGEGGPGGRREEEVNGAFIHDAYKKEKNTLILHIYNIP